MAISLSQGMRNAVYSMGDIQSQIDVSNKRLATGKKVNSAIDNARAYFAAEGFKKDGRDLSGLLDSMDIGLRIVTKANNAYDSMRKLVESAQSIARTARSLANTDAAGRDAYGTQVAELMAQVSRLAFDSGFNGKTLMQTDAVVPAQTDVVTNTATTAAAQTKISIVATDVRLSAVTGLGASAIAAGDKALSTANNGINAVVSAGAPETVTYANGNWSAAAGDTKLDSFINFTVSALTQIAAKSASASNQATAIQIRQEFTKNWIRTNNEAADYLTLADINEEGAALSALQTKQQLAVQALSLASRADQAILRLF